MRHLVLFLLLCTFAIGNSQVPYQEDEVLVEEGFIEVEEVLPDNGKLSLGYFKDQGKYGLYVNGQRITEAVYERASPINGLGYIVKQQGKFGFIDPTTEPLIPIKYDTIYSVRGLGLVVQKKDRKGCYAYDGKKILPIRYKNILGGDPDRYILVETKKGLSLLNNKGKRLFKTPLTQVELFKNTAFVKADGKYAMVTDQVNTGLIYDSLLVSNYDQKGKRQRTRKQRAFLLKHQHLDNVIVVKDSLAGLLNLANELLVPIENEKITYDRHRNYYTTTIAQKMGVYLEKCNTYFPPQFDHVYMDGRAYLQVTKAGKKGIIDDQTGQYIIPIVYENIAKRDTVFIVTKDKKKGVINRKGDQLIPNMYDDIDNLGGSFNREYDGFLKVTIDSLSGMVNGHNKTIIPIDYSWLGGFDNKLILVRKANKVGLYNTTGNLLQPTVYDFIRKKRTRHSKVFMTRKKKLLGLLDEDGHVRLKNEYERIAHIPDDAQDIRLLDPRARKYFFKTVHQNGEEGVINGFTGEFVIPLDQVEVLQMMRNYKTNTHYLLIKKNGKYGMVDEANNILIDFVYEDLDISKTTHYIQEEDFLKTSLVTKKNGKYGIINLLNEVKVPFKYKALKKIDADGLFKAKQKDHYVLINSQDEVLNKGPFDDLSNYEYPGHGRTNKALSFYDGKMKAIDHQGKFISRPIEMKSHEGFTSFMELKLGLIEAMEEKDDSLLLRFAQKIAPSPHMIYWLQNADRRLSSRVQYLDYDRINQKYYSALLMFKRRIWDSPYFDQENLYQEDFTVTNDMGLTTNKRMRDWAYDNNKVLEKILRNAIKINGYWISTYFLTRGFN